ncbi:MAG: hypothetical protein JWO79_1802 [Actinomycetia bacterium]|jgi:hypothetical protein|nr:hypothetical protein [Actinomycetes bacterium]MDQ1658601.1 hypothetical protein [Cryptosporangiaceae bacterium]
MTIAAAHSAALPVEPGGEAVYELTVRNTGTVVDVFTVTALGDAASWVYAEPAELPLFPGAEGTILLRFRPPRHASTPAGDIPWAVRISSRENAAFTWVEEGLLQVSAFAETTAEIAPQTTTARGRGRGKSQLAIDNRGNTRAEVRLFGGDDDGNVQVEVLPRTMVLEPGTAQLARVRVRAKKSFWRGAPKTHPYKVVVDDGRGEPRQLPATLIQDTAVPSWLVKLLIALVVLATVLALLWATLVKKTIEDYAKAAADKQATAVAKKEAKSEAAKAVDKALAGKPIAAAGAGVTPVAPPKANGDPDTIDPLGAPKSFRLAVTNGSSASKTLDSKNIVSITDIFYENPLGDAGMFEIYKNNDLIYRTSLNNWRDYDQHRNAPLEFAPGDKFKLKVSCENKGAAASRKCSPAVSLAGFVRKPAE